MRLPQSLQDRPFTEWNYIVRGLMEMYELARAAGVETRFERMIEQDSEGTLIEMLGRAGNEWLALASTMLTRMHTFPSPLATILVEDRVHAGRERSNGWHEEAGLALASAN
jgi:hypothetical protein